MRSFIERITLLINEQFLDRPNRQAVFILAFWMITSRLLGAIRTLVIGQLPSVEADLFNSAFIIPDNIIAIFILGSIAVASLPHIIELANQKPKSTEISNSLDVAKVKELQQTQVNQYTSYVLLLTGGLLIIISLVCIIVTPQLLTILNYDLLDSFDQLGRKEDFINLTRVLLLAPLLFGIKTVMGSYLNAYQRFGIYAIDGVITNLGILIGLVVLYRYFGMYGAVGGVLLGFSVSTISFVWDSYKHGFNLDFGRFPELQGHLMTTLQLYLPRLLIIPTLRITETLVAFTTKEADGSISALRTALDFQGIPLGLITITATVFLPNITTLYVKEGASKAFWSYISQNLRLTALAGLVGAVGVAIGVPVLFRLLDSVGLIAPNSFFADQRNVDLIFICVIICASSLVFQCMNELYQRIFIAIRNTNFPLITSVISNIFHVVLTLILVPFWGSAIATASGFAGSSVCALFFSWLLSKRIPSSK